MAPDFLALVPWALATRSGGFDGRAGLGLFIIGRELSPNLCMQTGATNFRVFYALQLPPECGSGDRHDFAVTVLQTIILGIS